jgi:quinol monooxygenase YgiN
MGLFSSDKTSAESGHINVIAEIKARRGEAAKVRAILTAIVPLALTEKGCKSYHLLEAKHEEGSFYTYEEWESEADLEVHLEGAKPKLEAAKSLLDGGLKLTVFKHLV